MYDHWMMNELNDQGYTILNSYDIKDLINQDASSKYIRTGEWFGAGLINDESLWKKEYWNIVLGEFSQNNLKSSNFHGGQAFVMFRKDGITDNPFLSIMLGEREPDAEITLCLSEGFYEHFCGYIQGKVEYEDLLKEKSAVYVRISRENVKLNYYENNRSELNLMETIDQTVGINIYLGVLKDRIKIFLDNKLLCQLPYHYGILDLMIGETRSDAKLPFKPSILNVMTLKEKSLVTLKPIPIPKLEMGKEIGVSLVCRGNPIIEVLSNELWKPLACIEKLTEENLEIRIKLGIDDFVSRLVICERKGL